MENLADDQEYIDMEITSSCSPLLLSQSRDRDIDREFEFQMVSTSSVSNNPSADELFHEGKILPLQIPPRLRILQNLLSINEKPFEQNSESARFSSDKFNFDDYFFEWSFDQTGGGLIIGNHDSTKNLSLTKKISLTQKLKTSLKSFFNKSSACTKTEQLKYCFNRYLTKKNRRFNYKSPTMTNIIIDNNNNNNRPEIIDEEVTVCIDINHRRSFSGAIQRHCYNPNNKKIQSSSSSSISSSGSSSSSSSSSGFGFYNLQSLKRSNSEIENSIEGAIAHCKQSQLLFTSSGKLAVETRGSCLLSASRISASGDQERPGLCSI